MLGCACTGLMGLGCGCSMPMSGLGAIFPYKTSTCEKLKARIDLLAGPKYSAQKYQDNRALFVTEYDTRCAGSAPITTVPPVPVAAPASATSKIPALLTQALNNAVNSTAQSAPSAPPPPPPPAPSIPWVPIAAVAGAALLGFVYLRKKG